MDALPQDVANLVEYWTQVSPDREAFRYGEQSWTWSEFADRVDRNAAGQLAAGMRPGDRVAYLDKNHPACMETAMACLRIGTANAVVNFRLAPDEIRYVINDAQARIVFVGTEFLPV
ncbi:MAG TPA: AMP-binding protein, partial [Pseudonocardiaceae bacterium]